MNVGTGLPLFVWNNDIWNYDEEERLIAAQNGNALHRPLNQIDGVTCWWAPAHGGQNQKFTFGIWTIYPFR